MALAHLPAVVRSRQVLGRRLGGPQLPRGGEHGDWPQSSEAEAPGPDSQDAAPHLHPAGALTFHSARTSSASSRRPPRELPTMIQMGICESSCLEISNVICKVRGEARSTALLFWGPGGSLGRGRRVGDSRHLVGELHPLPQGDAEGMGCTSLLRGLRAPSPGAADI